MSNIEFINGNLEFDLRCAVADVSGFSDLSKVGKNLIITGKLTGAFPALDNIMGQLVWGNGPPSTGFCTSMEADFPVLRYVGDIVVEAYVNGNFTSDDFPLLEYVGGSLQLDKAFYDYDNTYDFENKSKSIL